MHILVLFSLFLLSGRSQVSDEQAWSALIDAGRYKQAKHLCTQWQKSKLKSRRAEAEKCLANVELSGNTVLQLKGNELGGGSLGSGYEAEALNRAIAHLVKAMELSPLDLSIHKGRLHLLESGSRYEEMKAALVESLRMTRGRSNEADWIPYPAELIDAGELHPALELLFILNQEYPKSHEIIGNIAAAYAINHEYEKALPFALTAVELAPKDPIDTWNLARIYEFTGEIKSADTWYTRALALPMEESNKKEKLCLYATFVETKLKNKAEACKLQDEDCSAGARPACSQNSK